jgi:hypothetical protein
LPVAVSLLLWLGAQFGLTRHLYEAFVALVDLPVSYKESGSFDLLAWQLLWLAGLGLGARAARGESPLPQLPGWVLGAAFAVAVPLFLWRHAVGQQPFPGLPGDAVSNLVFDKWTLGPVRMLDTLALTVLLLRYGPTWAARLPRMRFLEVLGAASLRVFCGHLVIVLLMLAFLGQANPERPLWLDLGLLAASFAALYALARVPSVNPLDLWHRAAPAPPPSAEGRSGSASSTRHSRLC